MWTSFGSRLHGSSTISGWGKVLIPEETHIVFFGTQSSTYLLMKSVTTVAHTLRLAAVLVYRSAHLLKAVVKDLICFLRPGLSVPDPPASFSACKQGVEAQPGAQIFISAVSRWNGRLV